MLTADFVGWGSSAILVATIARQVWEQWSRGSSEGVSYWLFAGQFVASAGLLIYSALRGDLVFMVTNLLMMATAVVGGSIVYLHRRRAPRSEVPTPTQASV